MIFFGAVHERQKVKSAKLDSTLHIFGRCSRTAEGPGQRVGDTSEGDKYVLQICDNDDDDADDYDDADDGG